MSRVSTELGDANAHEALLERAKAYDAELNRLEIPPNGDDYNELMSIIAGEDVSLPTTKGR